MNEDPVANPKADAPGNAAKPVEEWTTGDEPMTGAQASYLQTLCQQSGEAFDDRLTKAQASERIDALQEKAWRGKGRSQNRFRPTRNRLLAERMRMRDLCAIAVGCGL